MNRVNDSYPLCRSWILPPFPPKRTITGIAAAGGLGLAMGVAAYLGDDK